MNSLRRASMRIALQLIAPAVCVACTAPDETRVRGPGEPVAKEHAALLPFNCVGTLTEMQPVPYESLGFSVTPYACVTPAGVLDYEVDPSGKLWTTDELRAAEHDAFRAKFHRLAPDLRDQISKQGELAPVLADVWFATRLEDDQKLPAKDVLSTLNAADRKLATGALNSAIAARAQEIRATIESVSAKATVHPDSPAFVGTGPLLQIETTPAVLRQIGDLDGILFVGLTLQMANDVPTSEAWFQLGAFPTLQAVGADGDGVKVVDVLGTAGVYDTSYLALAAGSCDPPLGANFSCYCASSAPNAADPSGSSNPCSSGHMQHVLSVMKNTWTTLSGGAARHATTLAGNANTACGSMNLQSVVGWATGQGATVINRSATNGLSSSRYLDYVVTGINGLYPSVVAAAGNDAPVLGSFLRNGPVVGAADDHGSTDRAQLTMASFSGWQNYSTYWELPHLVAPGVNIDTVSDYSGSPGVRACSGTSFAAPQVSGTVAALQEWEPALKTWPEAVLPILMVSAFTNAAPSGPDGQNFSLTDAVDDHDGVGVLHALDAWWVAGSKMNGGNAATPHGFDYGTVTPSSWPTYSYYSEAYNASVPAGGHLRVAALLLNHPTCGAPATQDNCTADGFPAFVLDVDNPATGELWEVTSFANNYKYLRIQNTHGTTQTVRIRLYMWNWQGLPSDTFGLAWSSDAN